MKQFLKDTGKEVLDTVAPALGMVIGGPMGGIAARILSNKLLGKPKATVEELTESLMYADPDTLAELRKLDNDFKVQMERIGVDIEKIAADDRNSARQREMIVKDKTPAILAYGTMASFFGYIGAVTFYPMTTTADMDFIYLALGWLGGTASTVVAYYFGSSSGSKEKNQMFNRSLK